MPILVAALSLLVLLATGSAQIADTNFYTLWEATNLLAGDHPYRELYEWGVPLQAYVSALGQLVFGNRLLSEFVVHWAFIVAGVAHMEWKRFIVYDVAGAIIWGIGHSALGYALGASYERWERYATPAGLAILAILLVLIGGSKLLAVRRRMKEELEGLEPLEHDREAD